MSLTFYLSWIQATQQSAEGEGGHSNMYKHKKPVFPN